MTPAWFMDCSPGRCRPWFPFSSRLRISSAWHSRYGRIDSVLVRTGRLHETDDLGQCSTPVGNIIHVSSDIKVCPLLEVMHKFTIEIVSLPCTVVRTVDRHVVTGIIFYHLPSTLLHPFSPVRVEIASNVFLNRQTFTWGRRRDPIPSYVLCSPLLRLVTITNSTVLHMLYSRPSLLSYYVVDFSRFGGPCSTRLTVALRSPPSPL